MKKSLVIIFVVMAFTACVDYPIVKKEKPLFDVKGTFETISTPLSPPPIQQVKITGEGILTHLGKTNFEALSTLILTPPPPFLLDGTSFFIAANKDTLYTEFIGNSIPQEGGLVLVTVYHTITGGSGRFVDAYGYLEGVSLTDRNDPQGEITMEGKISY
ncbi:MAG TPA: hypothetical protein VK921_15325 [Anditalea sp.]|nr:hypothetical protein [Anditalea sp.]